MTIIEKIIYKWYNSSIKATSEAKQRHTVPVVLTRQFNQTIITPSVFEKMPKFESVFLQEINLPSLAFIRTVSAKGKQISGFQYNYIEKGAYTDWEEIFFGKIETHWNEANQEYNKLLHHIYNTTAQLKTVDWVSDPKYRAYFSIFISSQWLRTKYTRTQLEYKDLSNHTMLLTHLIVNAEKIFGLNWSWIINDKAELFLTEDPVGLYGIDLADFSKSETLFPNSIPRSQKTKFFSFSTSSVIFYPYNKNVLLTFSEQPITNICQGILKNSNGIIAIPEKSIGIQYSRSTNKISTAYDTDRFFIPDKLGSEIKFKSFCHPINKNSVSYHYHSGKTNVQTIMYLEYARIKQAYNFTEIYLSKNCDLALFRKGYIAWKRCPYF